jgi:4-amino-4-deoxy-L-arabinose transferase-like glycosyltransferase
MRQTLRPIVVLAALAFTLRLAFLIFYGGLDDQIHDSMADQYTYLDIAGNLADGRGFVVSKPVWMADANKPTSIVSPLYPIVLAPIVAISGDSLIPIRLVQLLLSVACVIGIYAIGRLLFGHTVGLIAGVLMAIYPAFVMYVRPIMSEGISFPLVMLLVAIAALMITRPTSIWLFALYGLVGGLLVLVKPEVALLVGMLAALVVWQRWTGDRVRTITGFSLAAMLLGITIIPYCFYNLDHHGRFSPLPNKRWALWDVTWLAEKERQGEMRDVALPERQVVADWDSKTEVERDQELYDMAVQFIIDNPDVYLKQRVTELNDSFPLFPLELVGERLGIRKQGATADGAAFGSTSLDDIVKWVTPAELLRLWAFRVIFVLAMAGWILSWRSRSPGLFLIGVVVLWNLLLAALVGGAERYRLQIDPFLIVLAAVGLHLSWLRLHAWRDRTRGALQPVPGPSTGYGSSRPS